MDRPWAPESARLGVTVSRKGACMPRILVRSTILLAQTLLCGLLISAAWPTAAPAYGGVDTTPPVTSAPGLPTGWQLAPFTVTLNATDVAGSGVRDTYYSIGQPLEYTTTTYTAPFMITQPGSNYINCRSWDWAGNIEQFKHFLIQLDLAEPVTLTDAKPTYFETASIRLTATDDASGISQTRHTLDNGATVLGGTATPKGWGAHTLRYGSTDVAGRVEATKSVDFELAVAMREVSGADRVGTSIALCQASYPTTASAVVVCSARSWPDALASSGLSGLMRAPILLTEPGTASEALLKEIARLKPGRVVLIGGQSAIAESVKATIVARVPLATVERIQGKDRYATSLAIFERIRGFGAYEAYMTPYVVSGESFADGCLIAQAARVGVPILYVSPRATSIPAPTVAAIRDSQVTGLTIVGGTAAVSGQTERALQAVGSPYGTPLPIARIAGPDRYATSVAVAKRFPNLQGLTFVTGRDYPDALCAAAYAGGVAKGRLVLIPGDDLGSAARALLSDNKAQITRLAWVGGERSITRATRLQAAAILGTPYRVMK